MLSSTHNTGGAKKTYTHFKRHVDTLFNVAQATVRRNHFEHLLYLQKSNVTCIHLLLSVYIECYNFNTDFSFLKMCIHFLAPPVYK
jgi:hypothetical protein